MTVMTVMTAVPALATPTLAALLTIVFAEGIDDVDVGHAGFVDGIVSGRPYGRTYRSSLPTIETQWKFRASSLSDTVDYAFWNIDSGRHWCHDTTGTDFKKDSPIHCAVIHKTATEIATDEADAKAKIEADAKMKADAEAKVKVEAEAKAKVEAEAKARAEVGSGGAGSAKDKP